MIIKRLLFLALLIAVITGCDKSSFSISGKITGAEEGTVIYIGDHETDIRCAKNTNEVLRNTESNLKVISIAALYDTDTDISHWQVQPDFTAEKVEDIIKIVKRIK